MAKAKLKSISPKQAYQLWQDDPRAVLIDIRSSMEFLFIGHPVGAIHVPWMDEPDWKINKNFVVDVRKVLLGGITDHDKTGAAPIILLCRSGKRTLEAGAALLKAHFSEVYHVDEGFEGEIDDKRQRGNIGGWRYHGLPWEQS